MIFRRNKFPQGQDLAKRKSFFSFSEAGAAAASNENDGIISLGVLPSNSKPAEALLQHNEAPMKAAVLHELGRPPRYEDFPDPSAGAQEALVDVRAASLKSVDKQLAAGTHCASPRELPAICGTDGVGTLPDGSRVFFGGARRPYGAMAQRAVVPAAFCFPIPDALDDATAAAVPNPGISAFLSLSHRAKLAKGEKVLILGATGVTGKLAVQIAKQLGAAKVIAAGRNPQQLEKLRQLGADSTIQLNQPEDALRKAFAEEAGEEGFNIIIDYIWGHPTEVLIAAITKPEFAALNSETRLVQVGESAGPTITLPAAVLRSTALTILGTAGIPAREILFAAMNQVLAWAATCVLQIETESVALSEIETVWSRAESGGRRLVVVP
jgi:NADPH:quinone reductase-like Zn-dependent oxidoreductase